MCLFGELSAVYLQKIVQYSSQKSCHVSNYQFFLLSPFVSDYYIFSCCRKALTLVLCWQNSNDTLDCWPMFCFLRLLLNVWFHVCQVKTIPLYQSSTTAELFFLFYIIKNKNTSSTQTLKSSFHMWSHKGMFPFWETRILNYFFH